MSIISRYIVSSYLAIIALCAGAFTSIYLVIDFLEKIGRFTRAQGKLQHILLFFLYKAPEIVNQVTPLAVLMATLLTLGMLSLNSELTAMRGCGLSLARITAPIFAIAAVAALVFSLVCVLHGQVPLASVVLSSL